MDEIEKIENEHQQRKESIQNESPSRLDDSPLIRWFIIVSILIMLFYNYN